MKWLIDIVIAIALSYFAIAIVGITFKLWYVLFMWGWTLV